MAGAAAGIVTAAAGRPAMGLVAGGLSLAAGLLGARAGRGVAGSGAETNSLTVGLTEQLALARLREQALQQRIEVLEAANHAAAESARVAASAAAEETDKDGTAHLTDSGTGLYSEAYFEVALETRIAAARRRLRPVALVLLDVIAGTPAGDAPAADAEVVTVALRRTLREADTACRLEDGRFALVLEDTPENGAIWTVERLRTHLAETGTTHTVWAGIACYPAHAFDKDEIMSQAAQALTQARVWRQDRIEVATAD